MVQIVSRTLSGLFLVGALNRLRKRKRTNRENPRTVPAQIGKIPGKVPKGQKRLLWPLSRNILWIFSSNLPGNFALKNCGDFWWIFSGLRLPQNEARQLLKKFGENSEQNSGQNSGRKIEKFGELSFCNFSDLTKKDKKGRTSPDRETPPFETPPFSGP